MHHLVLWEPTHGKRRPGRPSTTFVDTLKNDVRAANNAELVACMMNCDHWGSRRGARLRLLQLVYVVSYQYLRARMHPKMAGK